VVVCLYGLPMHAIASFFVIGFASGLGVTIGYHRLFSHRSFATYRWVERLLMILGCMAGQSSPFFWIATHRLHHRHSDTDGDPHSPFIANGRSLGLWRGFLHAHAGWFRSHGSGYPMETIPDLLRRADLTRIDRCWFLWYLVGLAIPAGVGYAIGGTAYDALIGFLCGGLLRHFVTIQTTCCVNSVNHLWGSRPYPTDQSRNILITGILALVEGWHTTTTRSRGPRGRGYGGGSQTSPGM
jgi:stearoyl-CoA desaturase (delta-9 desaturase)